MYSNDKELHDGIFKALIHQIEGEKNPQKKAKLQVFKNFCEDAELDPGFVIPEDFHDYEKWCRKENIEPENIMNIHEWNEEIQDIQDLEDARSEE